MSTMCVADICFIYSQVLPPLPLVCFVFALGFENRKKKCESDKLLWIFCVFVCVCMDVLSNIFDVCFYQAVVVVAVEGRTLTPVKKERGETTKRLPPSANI